MPLNNIQDNTYNRMGQYNLKHDTTLQKLSHNTKANAGQDSINDARRKVAFDSYSPSTDQEKDETVNVSDYKLAKALNAYQAQMQQNRY